MLKAQILALLLTSSVALGLAQRLPSSLFFTPTLDSAGLPELTTPGPWITTTSGPSAETSTQVPPTRSGLEELDRDEQPTRVPLRVFRPTSPPSMDSQPQPPTSLLLAPASLQAAANNSTRGPSYKMTSECFECICEAATSCNPNSRCQTSDVRHTRCGLYLISYDQWLETGLSKQLVSAEALARDAAADERAFYECVTDKDCAERLLEIYMQKNAKDCDKDGRVDCYDLAAIHQGGRDQCNDQSLLDSQYWSDFNACLGFGR